jgi:glutathione S-transferase
LLLKNVPYERTLVHPEATEVERLDSKHISSLPVFVHRNLILSEPFSIAEHIEKSFPFNSLTRQGVYSYQDVIEKLINFFPTLTRYITNNDATKEVELRDDFEFQLNLVEDILRSTPGRYLCGIELTLADLFIFPQIYHAIATALHFKRTEIYTLGAEPVRPALEKYITQMLEMEEFHDKRAYYNIDRVVNSWKIRRGDISIDKK